MKWIKNKWIISFLLLLGIFSAVTIYNNLTAKKDKVKYDDFSIKVDKILLFGDKQQYVVGLEKVAELEQSPLKTIWYLRSARGRNVLPIIIIS